VVSVTDPYGRIVDFLDRSRYFFFQVAPLISVQKSLVLHTKAQIIEKFHTELVYHNSIWSLCDRYALYSEYNGLRKTRKGRHAILHSVQKMHISSFEFSSDVTASVV
jgi:hypothetical protein